MLRRAVHSDLDAVQAMWVAPANSNWIEAPDEGEIAAAIARGHAFVWAQEGTDCGFAVIHL
jgi:hypothetical protein